MATDVIVVPTKKVILDIILVMCAGFPILFMFLWGTPYRRGFFCDDEDLIHPYHNSTVPSIYLYIVGICMNCVVMILIEYLNQPHNNQEITFLGFSIPSWVHNAYYVLLVFAFGMACTHLTVDVMKYTIGRLRPHFMSVCVPDVCLGPDSNKHIYHIDFNCTGQFKDQARIMKEMRLSFPSGHSSFSMFTMVYFAIYLQKRMDWDGSKLLKHILQYLAVLAAIFTAMTRISDYKHHWSDVLIGMLIGTIGACITARYISTLFQKRTCDDALLKQEAVTEMQGLNGNNRQRSPV